MDKYEGMGGSYTVNKRGERELVECTKDHPDGNCPRDAQGRPLDPLTGKPMVTETAAPAATISPTALATPAV